MADRSRAGESPQTIPPFVTCEKTLIDIGFFSVRSRRAIKQLRQPFGETPKGEKIIGTVHIDGRVDGYPDIRNLTTHTAWESLVTSRYLMPGKLIPEEMSFLEYEIIKICGDGGYQRDGVDLYVRRLQSTFIESDYAVYDAEAKVWIVTTGFGQRRKGDAPNLKRKRRLQVFANPEEIKKRIGEKRGRGPKTMNVYTVTISKWYRKNLELHWSRPTNARLYFLIRKPIAKAAFRWLETSLFAGEGFTHKRYDDFCSLLGMTEEIYAQRIHDRLDPAMNELIAIGFLKSFTIHKNPKGDFVLEWTAGPLFWQFQEDLKALRGSFRPDVHGEAARAGTLGELPFAAVDNTANQSTESNARVLVAFFKKLRGKPKTSRPPRYEIVAAKKLLDRVTSLETAKYVVKYACKRIVEVNNNAHGLATAGTWGQVFGSVDTYVGEALEALESKRKEQGAAKEAQAMKDDFNDRVQQLVSDLSPNERAKLEATIAEKIDANRYIHDYLLKLTPELRQQWRAKHINDGIMTHVRDRLQRRR